MFAVFIMTILGIWLASFAITYFTYYMGPDIFQVLKYDETSYSHPENVINITKDELKEYTALEKAINGVDCIEPGPNSSLCKAASTEDFNKIKNFIDSRRKSPGDTCFNFEKYEGCYKFNFVRP